MEWIVQEWSKPVLLVERCRYLIKGDDLDGMHANAVR